MASQLKSDKHITLLDPFGLTYFLAYVKHLMFDKSAFIIYNLVKVVSKKTTYLDTILFSNNL